MRKFDILFISNKKSSYLIAPLSHFPDSPSTLGRPRCRWEDNIKMDLQETGGGWGDWMELAQDRDSTVMNLRVP